MDALAEVLTALRDSEERLRILIGENADAILIIRPDGVIRFVNPAGERLLGRRSKELVGRPFGMPIIRDELAEIDVLGPGNEVRIAEMRSVAVTWEGEPAFVATLRDITQRKRTEESLRQLAEENARLHAIEEAAQRRDRFMALLAHELRNPLSAILHALDLQRVGGVHPSVAAAFDVIDRQARHLGRLVEDLLEAARVVHGKIVLRRRPVEVDLLLRDAIESSQVFVERASHELRVHSPAESVWIDADAERMTQVLVNLLHNASKYTAEGGRIELECRVNNTDEVIFQVRDNGMGISAESLPTIFDPFYQADGVVDRASGGLGLGLALVKNLVEQHGGRVEAHSEGLGRGSVFTVALPRCPAPAADNDVSEPSASGTLLRRRILLVEDDADNRTLLGQLLTLWGHEVRTAADGVEALRLATDFRADVALIDLNLPGMSGAGVAEQLRQAWGRSTRLVALTGYSRPTDVAEQSSRIFDAWLVKPVDLEFLRRFVGHPEVNATHSNLDVATQAECPI